MPYNEQIPAKRKRGMQPEARINWTSSLSFFKCSSKNVNWILIY
jgi:hypothetical protein